MGAGILLVLRVSAAAHHFHVPESNKQTVQANPHIPPDRFEMSHRDQPSLSDQLLIMIINIKV
jgi:hypothetical protein